MGGIFGGGDKSNSIKTAARIQAEGQQKELDYLKEVEQPVLDLRNIALPQLASLYGLGDEDGDAVIRQLQNSPLYEAMTGQAIQDAEQALLRNQAATGRLRGAETGNLLADNTTRLQNQALLTQVQGLGSFASPQLNTNQIAQGIAAPYATNAQGRIAAVSNQQAASQAGFGNLLGAAQLGIGAASAFSDIRLKDKLIKIGSRNGLNLYRWCWNEEAEKLGLEGDAIGYIAQEVERKYPDAVSEHSGYKMVNYAILQ